MKNVKLRLKELRMSQNLTQKQVAEAIGILPEKYWRIELGKIKLKVSMVVALAVFYNTSTDYIACLTDEIIPHPRAKGDLRR